MFWPFSVLATRLLGIAGPLMLLNCTHFLPFVFGSNVTYTHFLYFHAMLSNYSTSFCFQGRIFSHYITGPVMFLLYPLAFDCFLLICCPRPLFSVLELCELETINSVCFCQLICQFAPIMHEFNLISIQILNSISYLEI